SRLLAFDVMLRAQEVDHAGAARSVRAMLKVGRALGEEYTLITFLIRAAEVNAALSSLERLLAQGEPAEADLAEIQRLLEREEREFPAAFRAALRGERALTHRMFTAMESGRLPTTGLLTGGRSLPERLGNIGAVATLRHSHAVYLRRLAEAV